MIKSLKRSFRKNIGTKRIVCLGGGSGLFSILSGLKEHAILKRNLKAIVTTVDNGGSSGRLITQYGVLPPGDVRNCMVALSDNTELVKDLFQYRFDNKLGDHNFGNLLITALTDITGSFDQAVKEASHILRINGEVIPVSLEKNTLMAETTDGRTLEGESKIDLTPDKVIKKIHLKDEAHTNKRAVEVLEKAHIIIFGPGDLYTSILPNVLFPKIKRTIQNNKKAKKVLIVPVMSKPGETDDYTASKFKEVVENYLGTNITHMVVNTHVPNTKALQEYKKEKKHPIEIDEENIDGCKLIKANLIDEDKLLRHNPQKIAKAIMKLL